MSLPLPTGAIVTVEVSCSPTPQLRLVVAAMDVCLPFGVGISVAPDDVHLEVTMYVVDRDTQLSRHRTHLPRQPSARDPESYGSPFLRQVFSFDMSDEVVALRQMRVIEMRERGGHTDAQLDAAFGAEVTDDEVAKLVLGCVSRAVEHEVRESVYHKGRRVDDPHAPEYARGKVP